MKQIKFIGLDMDHTLIRYHTQNFEALVYEFVQHHLVEEKHYPPAIQSMRFNFNEAIRGLVIDSKHGNILKLSRYGAIRQSYHGTKAIDFAEQKSFYRSTYVDLSDPNYMAIDTSFSIAFCVLYGQLIDYKDQHPELLPDYRAIALDVLTSVDTVHANGSLKKQICRNLDQFVIKEQAVVDGLKRCIRHGKRIFLLTNSDYSYTNRLLNHALGPFLQPGENWRDLFQYVITLANKPRFFYDNFKFLKINPEDETMTNMTGKICPGIYQGGCATKFTDDLGLKGDEILYIGDHIYGDIVRLKKDCNWRTALVVEELGEEIAAQYRAYPIEQKLKTLMKNKQQLEKDYINIHTLHIEHPADQHMNALHTLQTSLADIDHKISTLLIEQQHFFNVKWDRVFRAGAEESYFAYQVDRYACIYMEKLSDLLEHSPLSYFRATRRLLAHDIDTMDDGG